MWVIESLCAILFRGVVLPWRIALWKPKGHSGGRYRKLTDLAVAMMHDFVAPAGVKARVLFDAFYLCPQVARACRDQGFGFFSVVRKHCCLTTANADLFEAFVEQVLAPQLRPGETVVMLNLSSHKRARTRMLIEAAGAQVAFLPAYSPDLNPIGRVFAKVK